MAGAASSGILLAAASAGVGWQRNPAAEEVGNCGDKGLGSYACSTRLCIPSGRAFPSYLTSRNLACTSGSLLGDASLVKYQSNLFRVLQAPSSSTGQFTTARAAVGTVTKEPVTGIEFSNTLTPPGASAELSLLAVGVREKTFAFLKVKVYAVGFYIDASSLAESSLSSWKGKSGSELSKDQTFFKALIEIPVEKAIKIVLARDIDGSQFWGALDESLTPRLKTVGPAGQEALTSLGYVFKDRALKQGTTVLLTWSQPATLQIAVSSVSSTAAAAPDATIESAPLLSSLFDVYLGNDPVSPSAAAAIASNFPSLL